MTHAAWTPEVLDELMAATGVAVDRGVRGRHLSATDWGEVVASNPPAVLRLSGRDEVAGIVQFARRRGLSVTLRGTGATEGGQSVAHGSVILDTVAMDDVVLDTAAKTITCGPGATWRAVLTACLAEGLVPQVVPLGLDVTVGGVLATGGVGSTSHHSGACVSNIVELEVVTGEGRIVCCSPTVERELYDAVVGGLGRVAMITKATLTLRPVGPVAHMAKVHYDDLATWIADVEKAAAAPGITHVETFAPRAGLGAQFDMTIAADGPDATAADVEKALAELNHATVLEVAEVPIMRFSCRLDPRLENLIAAGRAGQLHPWVESFVTFDAVARDLPDMLAQAAGDMNDKSHIVLVDGSLLPPLVPVPSRELIFCVVIAPVGVPRADLDEALASMRRVHDLVLASGGKRYFTGWLPEADQALWREHLGDGYDAWAAAKQAHDPDGVFTSALLSASAPSGSIASAS
jgi:cytokinin dehydrogenase